MDAVSMYTNIHLNHALPAIIHFLETDLLGMKIRKDEGISVSQLAYTLDLIMNNNVFQFGDTYWLQLAGTAMGTPPAPDYATLYFAIHEHNVIKLFPEIQYYRRYIDDGFGIWTPNPLLTNTEDTVRWSLFKATIQGYGADHEFFLRNTVQRPLRWEFITSDSMQSEREKSKVFLDLTISLHNNYIETKIYEKELNLYLYLPPHSCHPPGTLKGLIFGFAHRAHSLCTNPTDRMPFMRKSYCRLLARGYRAQIIRPLFLEAIHKVFDSTCTAVPTRTSRTDNKEPLYFHLTYNPINPTSHQLQSAFKNNIIQPINQEHISNIPTQNSFGGMPDFNRAIICYSGQRNIGNYVSPRKHRFGENFSVSTYYETALKPTQDG